MLTFRPIKSDYVSQKFGENLACAKYINGVYVVQRGTYPGTCPVDTVKFYPALGMKGHNGVDRPCIYREPVYFSILDAETGWDLYAELDSQLGMGVGVVSTTPFFKCREPGCGLVHYMKQIYWHCAGIIADVPASGSDKEFSVKELYLLLAGEERVKVKSGVQPGELVGYGDSTGASGGNHVHDGFKYCDQGGNGIHEDNGYYGAIDISDSFVNKFILDELAERKEEDAKVAESYKKYQDAEVIRSQIVTLQFSLLDTLKRLLLALQQKVQSLKK